MTDSDISTTTDSGCSRRGFLARGAATAGAVGTIAAGGSKVAPQYAPVGRAQAVAPVAVAAGVTLAFGAGVAYAEWQAGDAPELDYEDVLEDQIYNGVLSVIQGREDWIDETEHEYLGRDDPQDTPYGRTAWSEIRAEVAKGVIDGKSNSEIVQDARDAHDKQTAIAVWNIAERWNTFANAIMDYAVAVQEDSDLETLETGAEYYDSWGYYFQNGTSAGSDYEPIEHTEDDNYVAYTSEFDLPYDVDDIDELDLSDAYRDEPFLIIFSGEHPYDSNFIPGGPIDHDWTPASHDRGFDGFVLQHSEYDTVDIGELELIEDVLDIIYDAHTEISNDIPDYVDNIAASLDQGAIDPDDILSSQDVVDQFADSEEQSRLAAELLATGATVPKDSSYRATVSHPDLAADQLEGVLFPQFTDDAVSLRSGMTLEAGDYDMAYIGYESAASGEWRTELLSGEEDLEIHHLDGFEDQISVSDDGYDETAYGDGEIILWSGDDAPDPLENPGDDEYDGWQVVVNGADNEHVAELDDVEQDDDTYLLPESDLDDGEAIESVEIVPSAEYSRVVDYVADPTDPEGDDAVQRLEDMRQQIDDLEEALGDDAHGGGGGGGGGINDTLIIGGVAALLGSTALAALVGRDS